MKETEKDKQTSVGIPMRLWRAARWRALDTRGGLRAVICAALEQYLKEELREVDRMSKKGGKR